MENILTTGVSEFDRFDTPTFIRRGIKIEPAERITREDERFAERAEIDAQRELIN
jgi:hypothetical protein